MKTFEIDVNVVDAGSGKGNALQANPKQVEIELPSANGKVKHARVNWRFKHLPAGLTPVIAFDSPEVIASGPTTTRGAAPQVTCEIKLPSTAKPGEKIYASYTISASSGSAKASEALPPPDDGPNLVVIRSPDPQDPPPSGEAKV